MAGEPEFPGGAWTAFDRYSRYGAVARALGANLGARPATVLDVGDSSGYLEVFAPGRTTITLDLSLSLEPLEGTVRTVGDGCHLPFRDGAFDAVVSSDALEHVPADGRAAFLGELARVAGELVVVAAPFRTPGVESAEDVVRRYALLATGRPQDQLEEHRAHGLPDLDGTCATLLSLGMDVASGGAGNLYDWMAMMVLKHQLAARPALAPLEAGYDQAYNGLFSARDHVAPFYRNVVVARRDGRATLGGRSDEPAPANGADVAALLGVFTAANASEAVRQDADVVRRDLEQRLAAVEKSLAEATAGAGERAERLGDRLGRVEGGMARMESTLAAVAASLDHLGELVRHPVAGVVRRVKNRRS